VVLSSGDTTTMLLASSAIPGVFPAIDVEGRQLIDGGSSADVPITPAVGLGATTLYVLPTAPDADVRPSLLWQALDRIFGQPVAAAASVAATDVIIHRLPAPRPDANPTSFRSSRRLVAESLAMARDFLDALESRPAARPVELRTPSCVDASHGDHR
jgi:NTE family protein